MLLIYAKGGKGWIYAKGKGRGVGMVEYMEKKEICKID